MSESYFRVCLFIQVPASLNNRNFLLCLQPVFRRNALSIAEDADHLVPLLSTTHACQTLSSLQCLMMSSTPSLLDLYTSVLKKVVS